VLIRNGNKCTWYGNEITYSKYVEILELLRNRPSAPDGFGYRLTESLEWELYELPIVEDEDISEAEALDIILGGAV
jgi:hypothetical protein